VLRRRVSSHGMITSALLGDSQILKETEIYREDWAIHALMGIIKGRALDVYLHRFGKKGNPTCECGYGKETVEHYLLGCRKYREQRKTLRKNVGVGRMKTRILLGNIKVLKHAVEYITATGRLG
jgi:hypothetical protein